MNDLISVSQSLSLSLSLDIPVKVVGILPLRNERGMLLKMAYALYERLSFYRYGRIELNLFIREKEYLVKNESMYHSVLQLIAECVCLSVLMKME